MTLYLLIFLFPALFALLNFDLKSNLQKLLFYTFGFFLICFVGLRFENGVDWWNYLIFQSFYEDADFFGVFELQDPGYGLLNWLSYKLFDGSIFFVNFISALIFISGVLIFSKHMPSPWLSLTISLSFLIIVMGMNYTRQSSALGFALIAITYLFKQKQFKFFIYVFLAITFHKSAIILLPLALIGVKRKLIIFTSLLFLSPILFYVFVSTYIEAMIDLYLTGSGMDSAGAFIRVSLSFIASIFYFLYRQSLVLDLNIQKIFDAMAVINAILFIMLFIFPSTTVIDRFALFFTPIQLFMFSALPFVLKPFPLTLLIVVFVYAAQLYLWLSYSDYATLWIPYNFWIF